MELPTVFDVADYRDGIARDGYAMVPNVVSMSKVEELRSAIESIPAGEEVRRRTNVYGVRNLLELSLACRELAASPEIRAFVKPILGHECFAARGTFFDKVPGANWNLRWHQDSVISVKKRIEAPGFHAWATKAGVTQVRPPFKVLANMLAIRIHLDDCNESNGALRILKGSHHQRWERDDLSDAKSSCEMITCEVPLGGILAMRPLALHASSASDSPHHRRVIHIEYASTELPFDLEWKNQIKPD